MKDDIKEAISTQTRMNGTGAGYYVYNSMNNPQQNDEPIDRSSSRKRTFSSRETGPKERDYQLQKPYKSFRTGRNSNSRPRFPSRASDRSNKSNGRYERTRSTTRQYRQDYRGRSRSPYGRRREYKSDHRAQLNWESKSGHRVHRRRDRSPDRFHKTKDEQIDNRCSKYSTDEESSPPETEHERRRRWQALWEKAKYGQPPRPKFTPLSALKSRRRVLQIEYWERTPDNADRKQAHMDQLDRISKMSREEWILNTTLLDAHVAIEPNLFPYETPAGVKHYTLWSRTYLYDDEVESWVEEWLDANRPNVRAWAWDPSNLSEGMSIDLYHVHVFFWEPPKRVASIKSSRSRSHRAQLPLPDPSDDFY